MTNNAIINKDLDKMTKEELRQYLKDLEEKAEIDNLNRRIRELENPNIMPSIPYNPYQPRILTSQPNNE